MEQRILRIWNTFQVLESSVALDGDPGPGNSHVGALRGGRRAFNPAWSARGDDVHWWASNFSFF